MIDDFQRGLFRNNFNTGGILEDLPSQKLNGRGHGCREQQVLPFLGHVCHDVTEVWSKAHVEHHVGFVENHGFNAA